MTRILRCATCTKRIREHHAHIGLIDYESGREISKRASQEMRPGVGIAATPPALFGGAMLPASLPGGGLT